MDRNPIVCTMVDTLALSLSARRAWIEIHHGGIDTKHPTVALRKESVDRNQQNVGQNYIAGVALRKESVDRNPGWRETESVPVGVALRKESVDRNQQNVGQNYIAGVALRKESVDRNNVKAAQVGNRRVALRKESVDRNFDHNLNLPSKPSRSPQGERG